MTLERSLDCRGLSEAIAVLRIKQALDCETGDQPKLRAQLCETCCADTVLAGLRADATSVSVVPAAR